MQTNVVEGMLKFCFVIYYTCISYTWKTLYSFTFIRLVFVVQDLINFNFWQRTQKFLSSVIYSKIRKSKPVRAYSHFVTFDNQNLAQV